MRSLCQPQICFENHRQCSVSLFEYHEASSTAALLRLPVAYFGSFVYFGRCQGAAGDRVTSPCALRDYPACTAVGFWSVSVYWTSGSGHPDTTRPDQSRPSQAPGTRHQGPHTQTPSRGALPDYCYCSSAILTVPGVTTNTMAVSCCLVG